MHSYLTIRVLVTERFFVRLLANYTRVNRTTYVRVIPSRVSGDGEAALQDSPQAAATRLRSNRFSFDVVIYYTSLQRVANGNFFRYTISTTSFTSTRATKNVSRVGRHRSFSENEYCIVRRERFSSPFSFA